MHPHHMSTKMNPLEIVAESQEMEKMTRAFFEKIWNVN